MNLQLPELRYKAQPGRVSFHEKCCKRLSTIPNVQSAAMVTHVSLFGRRRSGHAGIRYRRPPCDGPGEVAANAIVQTISPNYFGLMRCFRDGVKCRYDADGHSAVAVHSRSLARGIFQTRGLLGKS